MNIIYESNLKSNSNLYFVLNWKYSRLSYYNYMKIYAVKTITIKIEGI